MMRYSPPLCLRNGFAVVAGGARPPGSALALSGACVSKDAPAMPEPNGRRRATPPASYGSASHPAIIVGKDSRKADAVPAPNQNIENNPMQSSMGPPAWIL
jgi:hypothetical protein